MSTPKIKVYRLDKGYNQDSDNDIQPKTNDEILPFFEKPVKSTDSYFLTGVKEICELSNNFINSTPQETTAISVIDNVSEEVDCSDWIKNGFFKPRVGYIKDTVETGRVWLELAPYDQREFEIIENINKVNEGTIIEKPYYSKEDLLYCDPLIFFDTAKPCYNLVYNEDQTRVKFELDADAIKEVYGTTPTEEFVIQYYVPLTSSNDVYLKNYPIYNGKNYFYKPYFYQGFSENLTIDTNTESSGFRNSNKIICYDWIFKGLGQPIISFNGELIDKELYEFIYEFDQTLSEENRRTVYVKFSEDFITENKEIIDGNADSVKLWYTKPQNLLEEGIDYNLNYENGLISFLDGKKIENLITCFYKKVQMSNLFISENVNWSFGHLRENPDIFFGEQDYPGDESQDTDDGTPMYAGLKPTYLDSGYQIDYMRGSVTFLDGEKSIYRSTASSREERDTTSPETFVRANYSYYPEIRSLYRQKLEQISNTDGFSYKAVNDKKYPESIGKRWIQKNDEYQPIFFELWTDKVNVSSQYLTTAPNYDMPGKKEIISILSTNTQEQINDKLTFILPFNESKFIMFSDFTEPINCTITINSNDSSISETFNLTSIIEDDNEKFFIDGTELIKGIDEKNIIEFGTKVKMKIVYLNTDFYSDSGNLKVSSFQIISINQA